MKEVYLQRYLESLLRLLSTTTIPFFGFLWQNSVFANLGQLVLADIYNCNAIYSLQNIDQIYDNNREPKLTLIQREDQLTMSLKSQDVCIPATVGAKLQGGP